MATRGKKLSDKKKKLKSEDDVMCPVCVLKDPEIECEICLRWFHPDCANISQLKLAAISNYELHWYCDMCEVGAATLLSKINDLITQNTTLDKKVKNLTAEVKKAQKDATTNLVDCETLVAQKMQDGKEAMKEELKSEIKEELKNEIPQVVTADEPDNNTNAWRTVGERTPTPNLRNIIQEEMIERKNIESLKKNLVMFGVKESANPNEDIEKVRNIIKDNLDIDAEIERVERLGRDKPAPTERPRIVKLIIHTQENRKKILQNANKLRLSADAHTKTNIFISPDLTKKQQAESKNLQAQLKATREANPGKIYKIK